MTTIELDEERLRLRIQPATAMIADRAVDAEETLRYCLRLLDTATRGVAK